MYNVKTKQCHEFVLQKNTHAVPTVGKKYYGHKYNRSISFLKQYKIDNISICTPNHANARNAHDTDVKARRC